MANEFGITFQLTYTNGQDTMKITPATLNLPQATKGRDGFTQVINTTTHETVTFSGLTSPSLLYFKSLEATTTGNFVTWGTQGTTGNFIPVGRLRPTDFAFFRISSTGPTIAAQANTAAVTVFFQAFEL